MIIIEDNHYPYLLIQKGDVAKYSYDRQLWQQKYEESIQATYENIKPHLPNAKRNVSMDIGSGLGGIDIMIYNHYKKECGIYLLDGLNDDPYVIAQNRTFSDVKIAADFLDKNGIDIWDRGFWTPDACDRARPDIEQRFSLFVSFASYCFHYSPKDYLEFIKSTSQKECTYIFDVRKKRPSWIKMLNDNFTFKEKIFEAEKWERLVFTNG